MRAHQPGSYQAKTSGISKVKQAIPVTQGSSSAATFGPRTRMAGSRTPFDSIEGALEYVGLLREAVEKAKCEVAVECERAAREGVKRQLEALQLAAYKLERLARHLQCGYRQLNDLRTIRRLLRGERREIAKYDKLIKRLEIKAE